MILHIYALTTLYLMFSVCVCVCVFACVLCMHAVVQVSVYGIHSSSHAQVSSHLTDPKLVGHIFFFSFF